jgi:hypothetical protein
MSSNSREDIYSVDLNGIDACEAGTVPSSSASNFESLTTNYELWGILPGPHGTWCTTGCCKLRIGSWVDEDAWTVWSLPWAASFFSSGLACTIRIAHRHCKSPRLTAVFFSKKCWRHMSCNDPCAFKMLLPKGLFLTEQTGQSPEFLQDFEMGESGFLMAFVC